jgi:hypothetical protein
MRRLARAVPLARMSVERRVHELRFRDQSAWPKHLRMAYEVLRYRLSCPEEVSLQLLIDAVRAAHACACRIDQRSMTIARVRAHTKMRKACACIANCAKRAPARLRRDLDRAVVELLRQHPIDAETIESLFDVMDRIFARYPDEEAAKTALCALGSWDDGELRRIPLKAEFQSLPSLFQPQMETRLSELASSASGTLTAAQVFDAMTVTFTAEDVDSDPGIATLIVDYLKDVKERWRAVGLYASRARDAADPSYASPFFQFAEFVLTAIVEPWARRHVADVREHARRVWEKHRELHDDFQQDVSPRLRRPDREWLVSDDHLKKALANAP